MEWELQNPLDGLGSGSILYVSAKDDYWGYPTGMGGRRLIPISKLIEKSDALVEMGTDWFENHDDLESLHSRVLQVRSMSARRVQMIPESDSWAHWSGGTVTDIYTDGSHAMDRTLGQFLLGKGS